MEATATGLKSGSTPCREPVNERRAEQQIHGRWPLVARHEALTEICSEIVVGRVWPRHDDAAHRMRQLLFHLRSKRISELGYAAELRRLMISSRDICELTCDDLPVALQTLLDQVRHSWYRIDVDRDDSGMRAPFN
ncbi:MAG: hypothetical protein SXG53_04650 [Pseudomonadota bacterium]|nr:hypothetical protein [Pseudomonadota bacterium]